VENVYKLVGSEKAVAHLPEGLVFSINLYTICPSTSLK
jgi:hypothetical protein